MYEEILTNIGFARSEILVYFALLEIGSSTTGPIIKKSGIASGKAYLVLDKLAKKGLITFTIKSGTKYYSAKDPQRILDYLHEKKGTIQEQEEEFKKILPKLKAQFDEKKYTPIVEVYEGVKGFKTFYEWTLKELKKGDTIHILGVPRLSNEAFEPFLLYWNRRRIEKGISMRIIYNYDCRDFGAIREKMKLTEVRYMKSELETPAWIDIFKEYVVTINNPSSPMCVLIRNKATAETYQKYFNIIWKQSEK